MDKVAQELDIPILLSWSIYLNDKDDESKMKNLRFTIKTDNDWRFSATKHEYGYHEYPGYCIPDLVANCLYQFTRQDDLVLDPMVGGGTTIDVCLAMNRRCKSFDNKTMYNERGIVREEVEEADVSNGLPDPPASMKNAVQLIFWDPPYYNKKDYGEKSVSAKPRNDFLESIETIAKSFSSWLKPGGVIAFLIQDYNAFYYNDDGKAEDSIMIEDYVEVFKKLGYRIYSRISSPYPTDQYPPYLRNKYTQERKMYDLHRELIVFSKGIPYDISFGSRSEEERVGSMIDDTVGA